MLCGHELRLDTQEYLFFLFILALAGSCEFQLGGVVSTELMIFFSRGGPKG